MLHDADAAPGGGFAARAGWAAAVVSPAFLGRLQEPLRTPYALAEAASVRAGLYGSGRTGCDGGAGTRLDEGRARLEAAMLEAALPGDGRDAAPLAARLLDEARTLWLAMDAVDGSPDGSA